MAKKQRRPSASSSSRIGGTESSHVPKSNPYPSFSFHHTVNKYTMEDCDKDEKALILSAMWRASRRTWLEFFAAGKVSGLETIPSTALKKPLPTGVSGADKVLVFRFRKKGRVIGYKSGGVFEVIWLDANHEIYDG